MRCPSGTANSSPTAGLTGNARSATDAQCRSRGPCRRAKARQRTADRGQCVSAWGRNSNAGSAETASFAAWNRRERWAVPRRSQRSAVAVGELLKAPVVGPPYRASPLGADGAEGASPQACVGREGRGWLHGQAMGRAATRQKHQGRIASGTTGARWCAERHGEDHHSKGLRFGARCTRGRQLDRAKGDCQCPPPGSPCNRKNCRLACRESKSTDLPGR